MASMFVGLVPDREIENEREKEGGKETDKEGC